MAGTLSAASACYALLVQRIPVDLPVFNDKLEILPNNMVRENPIQKLTLPRSPKITALSLALNPGSMTWRLGVMWNHGTISAS